MGPWKHPLRDRLALRPTSRVTGSLFRGNPWRYTAVRGFPGELLVHRLVQSLPPSLEKPRSGLILPVPVDLTVPGLLARLFAPQAPFLRRPGDDYLCRWAYPWLAGMVIAC